VLRLIVTRAGIAVATLFAISVVVFFATEALPGNVATAVLGRNATPASVSLIEQRLHLHESLPARYGHWVVGVLHGSFGDSLVATASTVGVQAATPSVLTVGHSTSAPPGVTVTSLIGYRITNTAILALVTSLFLIPLSLLLGTWAALRARRSVDHLIGIGTLTVGAMPEFIVGTVLVLVFAVTWHLLPAVSLVTTGHGLVEESRYLVLPVVVLLASMLAQTTRMVRAEVLTVLGADYVQTARLAGLSERQVLRQYILRNALAATIQVYAISIAWMFGGIVIVETVFQYPGLGSGLVNAVTSRDIPVVQAICLMIATVYIALNLVADVLTYFLTPRLRTS
jgi:peptide/nickel transport system permease protein